MGFSRSAVLTVVMLIMTGCAMQMDEHLAVLPHLSVKHTQSTPAVNAVLDDPAWKDATVINTLQPCKGSEQEDALPNPTTVKVLWDEQYLYVRFICEDDQLFIPHGSQRNGLHHEGDVVEVFVDPKGDGRQCVEVQLNPAGGILDVMHINTTSQIPNSTWVMPKADWSTNHWGFLEWDMEGLRTAASIHRAPDKPVTWVADMAIPAKTVLRRLGKETFEPMQMRINFLRCDGPADLHANKRTRLIASCWSMVPTGLPHLAPGTMGYVTLTHN